MEFYLRAQNRSPSTACQREQWEQALQFYQHDHTELRQQFVAEMRTLSKLRHPCITTVMGACIDPTAEPMLVMGTFRSSFPLILISALLTCVKILKFVELMERGSLHDLLHNEAIDFSGDIILTILRDVVQGLRFLHAAR